MGAGGRVLAPAAGEEMTRGSDDRAVAKLLVGVAALSPTTVIDAPKNLAIVIFNDELARLTKEQDAIEARLAAVA